MKSPANAPALNPNERRAAFGLASIYALRMLGLFLILPVFALYTSHLQGVTPLLVGLAIGIYGLTQAVLQIPFGLLSDRIGRKPVIVGGLLIFAVGSAVAADASTIHGVILGRALQGSGAVAAAVMALAADLSREEIRTRVMATIGMSIGASFMVAMVTAPLLAHWIGVPGIFWLTSALALAGVVLALVVVPTPERSSVHRDAEAVPALFGAVLRNPDLFRLNFGVFALHVMMTSLFLAVPLDLKNLGVPPEHHWIVYLPVMLVSVLAMVPFIILAEKRHHMKGVLLAAVASLGIAELVLHWLGGSLTGLVVGLLVYFTAFNLLEASQPSLVAKMAPAGAKGTAMGFFTSSQFMGAFVGGALGGWALQQFGVLGVFLVGAVAAALWLVVASGMSNPRYLSTHLLHVGALDAAAAERLTERLMGVSGVAEAVVGDDGVAYLKVDTENLDHATLDSLSAARA